MVTRRSIAQAAALPKELEAFVESGIPHVDVSSESSNETTNESRLELPSARPSSGRRRHSRQPRVHPHLASNVESVPKSESLLDEMLVPITTKLRRKTVQTLRRVYLEQKLRSARPATQQDIIQEAVEYWLKRNGHLCDPSV